MVAANQNATKALQISERAYVSLGDKNGNTIKLLKLQASHPVGVKIFLQNSGHIPSPIRYFERVRGTVDKWQTTDDVWLASHTELQKQTAFF
jgi:hypothetical protein